MHNAHLSYFRCTFLQTYSVSTLQNAPQCIMLLCNLMRRSRGLQIFKNERTLFENLSSINEGAWKQKYVKSDVLLSRNLEMNSFNKQMMHTFYSSKTLPMPISAPSISYSKLVYPFHYSFDLPCTWFLDMYIAHAPKLPHTYQELHAAALFFKVETGLHIVRSYQLYFYCPTLSIVLVFA